MPVPAYNSSGIIPPFLGNNSTAMASLSPHKVSVDEVVAHYHTINSQRKSILTGWLKYRMDLRAVGVTEGFQWLDGSFVEDKERLQGIPPNDLDIVVFLRRPTINGLPIDDDTWDNLLDSNDLFFPYRVKLLYKLDIFFVDLDSTSESIVNQTRYWTQVFGHQRSTMLWKGMLEVRQDDATEGKWVSSSLPVTPSIIQ